jgi:hypothetical protein
MDIEKPVTIVAGLLYIILEGPKLWRVFVKDNPTTSPIKQTANTSRFELAFRTIKSISGIIFIVAGLVWLFNSDKKRAEAEGKAKILQSQLSLMQENTFQDLPPTNVISDQDYANQRVYIDGNLYKHCNFSHVTFVFEGKRPFGFENCNFGQFDIDSPPVVSGIVTFFEAAEFINTNKLKVTDLKLPPERANEPR